MQVLLDICDERIIVLLMSDMACCGDAMREDITSVDVLRGINLKQARLLLDQSIEHARHLALPAMAVVILDSGGYVKASVTEDGASTLRHSIAEGKANAALAMGMNSSQFDHLLKQGVLSEAFSASLTAAANGRFNPNSGGLLLRYKGALIGAMGASGASAEQDEVLLKSVLQRNKIFI
ncbi:heme-binding protein [Agaribacterium sp. ZY112]|uniref:GlcG/HbpS family heme-binding protein n=1 Tax=Agaribacterium sp. ZY112 TaxID=3233574 RepID=UPI003524CBBB